MYMYMYMYIRFDTYHRSSGVGLFLGWARIASMALVVMKFLAETRPMTGFSVRRGTAGFIFGWGFVGGLGVGRRGSFSRVRKKVEGFGATSPFGLPMVAAARLASPIGIVLGSTIGLCCERK